MNKRNIIIGGGAALVLAGGVTASLVRMGSLSDYEIAMSALRAPLNPGEDIGSKLREIIRYATLAASSHNTQPWRFRVSNGSIRILLDHSKRTPVVDPDDHHHYISLGCAAENLALAAAACGLPGEIRFEGEGGGEIVFNYVNGATTRSDLCTAIPRRQSTRVAYDARSLPTTDLSSLERAAQASGVDAVLVTEQGQLDKIGDLVVASNRRQLQDRAFVTELKSWMRFNSRTALATGDGLFSACSGNPTLPDWLGPTMFDVTLSAEAENEKYARQLASSAGVVVFAGRTQDREDWIAVGRACQRFALQAAALGVKTAFVNQPVEVAEFRSQLSGLVGLADRQADIIMRFGYGPDLPMSPRRSIDAVIES